MHRRTAAAQHTHAHGAHIYATVHIERGHDTGLWPSVHCVLCVISKAGEWPPFKIACIAPCTGSCHHMSWAAARVDAHRKAEQQGWEPSCPGFRRCDDWHEAGQCLQRLCKLAGCMKPLLPQRFPFRIREWRFLLKGSLQMTTRSRNSPQGAMREAGQLLASTCKP